MSSADYQRGYQEALRAIQQKYLLVSLSDVTQDITRELTTQLRSGKNLNSYGEPVATTELPNKHIVEVTAERDGLDPKEYYYTIRVLAEGPDEEYKEMDKRSTRNASFMSLQTALNAVIRTHVKSPKLDLPKQPYQPLWSQLGNNDELGFIVRAANLSGSMEAERSIEVDDWGDLEKGLKEGIERYMKLSETSDPDFYAVVEDYLKENFPYPQQQRGLAHQIEKANATREASAQKAAPKTEPHR